MERAIIREQVTLVGTHDHIEIWPTEDWERHVEEQLPGYGETIYEAAERMRPKNDTE